MNATQNRGPARVANRLRSKNAAPIGGSWKLQFVLFAAMVLTLVTSTASRADEYDVKIFKYDNNGAYTACTQLNWLEEASDGSGEKTKRSIRSDNLPGSTCAKAGETVTINMDNIKQAKRPSEDDEVWLSINIKLGNTKSCRKEGTTFIYSSDGGTAKVRTAGTTQNNNLCKISCRDC